MLEQLSWDLSDVAETAAPNPRSSISSSTILKSKRTKQRKRELIGGASKGRCRRSKEKNRRRKQRKK